MRRGGKRGGAPSAQAAAAAVDASVHSGAPSADTASARREGEARQDTAAVRGETGKGNSRTAGLDVRAVAAVAAAAAAEQVELQQLRARNQARASLAVPPLVPARAYYYTSSTARAYYYTSSTVRWFGRSHAAVGSAFLVCEVYKYTSRRAVYAWSSLFFSVCNQELQAALQQQRLEAAQGQQRLEAAQEQLRRTEAGETRLLASQQEAQVRSP